MALNIKPPEPPEEFLKQIEREGKKGFLKAIFTKAKEPTELLEEELEKKMEGKIIGKKEAMALREIARKEALLSRKSESVRKDAEKVEALRKKLDMEIEEKRKEFLEQATGLDRREKELQIRERYLGKGKIAPAREKAPVIKGGKELSKQDIAVLDRKIYFIKKESKALEKKKLELEGLMTSRASRKKEKELEKREINIRSKEGLFEREKQELSSYDSSLRVMAEEVKRKLDDIRRRESGLAKKERKWIKTTRFYEGRINALKEKKAAFDNKVKEIYSELRTAGRELRRVNREWSRKEKVLDSMKGSLLAKEKTLFEKAAELANEHQMISAKKKEIRARETPLLKKEKEWEKIRKKNEATINEQKILIRQLGYIYQKKKDTFSDLDKRDASIKEKVRDLDKRDDSIREKEGALASLKQMLAEKESHLNLKAAKLDEAESLFAKRKKFWDERENGLKKGMKDIEDAKLELEQKTESSMEKIAGMESEWKLKEESLLRARHALDLDRKELQTALGEMKNDLNLLDMKEKQVVADVEGLEGQRRLNEKTLEAKESELLQSIRDIERDKRKLDSEEEKILVKVSKLEEIEKSLAAMEKENAKKENSIRKREARLAEETEKITSARYMKAELPKLKRAYDKLQKDLRRITDEAVAKRELLKDRERELVKFENGIKERERNLAERERLISQDEYDLVKERDEVKKGMFQEYVLDELHHPGAVVLGNKPAKAENPEICSLITQARDAVSKRKIGDARKIIAQIESMHKGIKEDDEKKKIGYDILELKTDVKLAGLA